MTLDLNLDLKHAHQKEKDTCVYARILATCYWAQTPKVDYHYTLYKHIHFSLPISAHFPLFSPLSKLATNPIIQESLWCRKHARAIKLPFNQSINQASPLIRVLFTSTKGHIPKETVNRMLITT